MFAANATVGVVLAACGSWGPLESCTLCLAPEHGFLHLCLVSLGPLKGQLGENRNWLLQRKVQCLSPHLAMQEKSRWLCIKHGGREKLPALSFLPSHAVDFIP